MEFKEFTGKTVTEAIEIGLAELGLTEEQAEIRVLEEGKKKLFGSVKARVEIAAKEEPVCDSGCCVKRKPRKMQRTAKERLRSWRVCLNF